MDVDRARRLDRFAGTPLCWAFSCLRQLAHTLGRTPVLGRPRKILIIKLAEMGSTVLACPALAELNARCPEAKLFFLVFRSTAPIVEVLNLAPAAQIITLDDRSVGRLLRSAARALRRLRAETIDTTIDMDFFSRFTALIAFIVCRGNRVGFHRYEEEGRYRGNLLTHRVMYSPHVHTSAAFMALTRTLFEQPGDEPHYRGRIDPADLAPPRHEPAPGDVRAIVEKLKSCGVPDGRTIILINPNSSDIFPLRKWPIEYFAELCGRLLLANPDCWLVITGIASEQKDARYITDRAPGPRCVDFTGRTSVRELLALYSIATLMVTNDSGPAHFASLLQLPTIVLFGPETPRLYGALGNTHTNLYAEFACSPCVSVYNAKKSVCGENRCLTGITVETVLTEVLARLPQACA